MDDSGSVDGADITPFFTALDDWQEYAADWPGLLGSMNYHGDCDESGQFDGADMYPFFDIVTNGCSSSDRGGGSGPSAEDIAELILANVSGGELALVKTTLANRVSQLGDTEEGAFWASVLELLEA